MKRIIPLLLAALALIPLSCRKAGQGLNGTWRFDRAVVTMSLGGGMEISKEFKTSEIVSLLTPLIGDGSSSPVGEEVLRHISDVGLSVDLMESGEAEAAVSLGLDDGTTVTQRMKGTYVREGDMLTVTVEERMVRGTILKLTDAELTLRVVLPEGTLPDSLPGQYDLYFVRGAESAR